MYALYRASLLVLVWATMACAQVFPLNPSHPLAQRLLAWWLVTPRLSGGPQWYGLLGQYQGTLVNFGSGTGWQPTGRPGGFGEMRFDGSNRVDAGSNAPWDFPNTTFAVSVRFRSTSPTGDGQLVTLRSTNAGGGWQVRLTGGALQARIYGSSASNVAAQLASVTTTLHDGLWHTATVVFQTDTTVQGGNNMAIYLDGQVNQGTIDYSISTDPYVVCPSGCALSFGAFNDGANFHTGALDDIRIYQRNIAPEVAWVLHICAPPSTCGLLADEALPLANLTPPTKRRVVIE